MIDNAKNKNMPSDLTKEATPISANEQYLAFFLEDKNKTSEHVARAMYKELFNPDNESCISLGSNANSVAPISANLFSTKRLHKK